MKTASRYTLTPLTAFFCLLYFIQIKLFLKFVVDEFVFLADSPLHIVLHLSQGGKSIVEFYILSPYIEKVCRIIVFGKFSCGTYVIVVFNSNIVVFPDVRNLFLIGSAIFSMVLSNSSIFLCGVTVFRIPLATLQSYFLLIRILLLQDRLKQCDIVPSCGFRKVYQTIFP